MPKITEHGGATNAAEPGPELTASTGAVIATSGAWEGEDGPELADLPYGDTVYPADSDETEAETEAPEEESSPGSSSSPSSETPPTEPETNKPARRSPAPKTASRSKKVPTDDSSVDSTAGDQTEATSAADATTTD
jgi:hypothetical protein